VAFPRRSGERQKRIPHPRPGSRLIVIPDAAKDPPWPHRPGTAPVGVGTAQISGRPGRGSGVPRRPAPPAYCLIFLEYLENRKLWNSGPAMPSALSYPMASWALATARRVASL